MRDEKPIPDPFVALRPSLGFGGFGACPPPFRIAPSHDLTFVLSVLVH